ncbi:Ger(x)C family spore germination protein [Paenibacillus sp. 1P07SE]|uniref:Ger(x)C family spore germination protein n=1 Tax=Paenibacillus sp. 1P07SE TaxID=3132209 RepID=UPI0039A50D83
MYTRKRHRSRISLHVLKGISALALLIFASGCWGHRDIDQLTVVAAIGLDAAPDNHIELSVQLVNPTLPVAAGANGQRRPFAMYSAKGETMFQVMEDIHKQAKKDLFFQQTRIILIDEKLARRGLEDYLDFFYRNTEQNPLSLILISKATARSTLQNAKELKEVPSDEWSDYFKNGVAFTPNMYQFLPRMDQIGHQPYAAGIAPISKGNEEILAIGGLAVFKQYKLVGWLTEMQSQALGWLQGEMRSGVMQFALSEEDSKPSVFELDHIRVRLVPVVHGNQVAFRVSIRVNADLKSSVRNLNLTNIQSNRELEIKLAEQIQEIVEQTIDHICKTHNSDIIGFGEAVHQYYPRTWKQVGPRWHEVLAELEVQVDVSAHLIKAGLKSDRGELLQNGKEG